MNQWTGTGNITRDVEVNVIGGDKTLAKFDIAVNERYKGEVTTTFVPVVVWGKLAEIAGEILQKGDRVLVQGKLVIQSYDKTDGTKGKSVQIMASMFEKSSKKPEDL